VIDIVIHAAAPGDLEVLWKLLAMTAYVILLAARKKRVLRPFLRLHESTHSDTLRHDRAARIPGQGEVTRLGMDGLVFIQTAP